MNRVEAVPTPKYWNVRQAVEELIRANRLRPGDRLPTEPELVERLLSAAGRSGELSMILSARASSAGSRVAGRSWPSDA